MAELRQALVDAAAGIADRIADAISGDTPFTQVALRLGWELSSPPPALAAIAAPARAIVDASRAYTSAPDDPGTWAQVGIAVGQLVSLLDALATGSFGAELDALGFGTFPGELLELVVYEYASLAFPRLVALARVMGVARTVRVAETSGRLAHTRLSLAMPDLAAATKSPAALWQTAWQWGTTAFDITAVLDELVILARSYGAVAGYERSTVAAQLLGSSPAMPSWSIVADALSGSTDTTTYRVGVRVAPLVDASDRIGLAILPVIEGGVDVPIDLGRDLVLTLHGTGSAEGAVALVVWPGGELQVLSGFDTGTPLPKPGASLAVTLGRAGGGPEVAVGPIAGVSFRYQGLDVTIGAGARAGEPADVWIELALRGAHVIVDGNNGPLAPESPVDVPVALTIGLSRVRGVYVGTSGLAISIPVGKTIGPLHVDRLALAAAPVASGVVVTAATDLRLVVGPVAISATGVGASLDVSYVGRGGSLGPLEVGFDTKLPDGLGIVVASPVISGGGFFARIPDGYAGALALDMRGIALTALGVYHQPAPGKRDLFALVEAAFPPIPIGLGFSLVGAGGVLALGRGVDPDVIRAGLRTGAVANTLFLGPGADLAGAIQSALAWFPARDGQLVVGPLVRIGWGTPRVAEIDVAVLLEAPAPTRLFLLAAAKIGLPTLTAPLVDLRFDALGVVDFDRGTLSIDASLHDSTIAGYAIGGDLALRLGWGDAPQFLLSIGGFHPKFVPPPAFPQLRRLSLVAGDNPQLRCEAYLAVTSNTVQIGARVDVHASGSGFEIKAHVGFDALFELAPVFQFEADVSAGASISWHGVNLVDVELDLTLTGPHPWHAKGEATFGVLWWDVSVGFDTTWGDRATVPPLPSPDVAGALATALAQPSAWSSELDVGAPTWITIAAVPSPDDTLVVHPFAAVVVRERVVPLEYPITQLGSIPLATPQRFAISSARVGTTATTPAPVSDHFAPGQFTQLSTDERISAPSFESFRSGARLASDEVRLGATTRSSLEMITDVFDPLSPPVKPPHAAVPWHLVSGLGARRPTRPLPRPPRAGLHLGDLPYVLASLDDLSITATGAMIGGSARTYAGLREALRANAASTGQRPRLQIVPRVQAANPNARVVVTREDDNLRNIDFVDTLTGRAMTRAAFVDAIRAGTYPMYEVPVMHGVDTPVSRANATIDDNLG